MLEARLNQANTLKKLLDSIKDLVKEANFDFNEDGVTVQSMDGSHVALASIELRQEAFDRYRCDRPMSVGINIESLGKIVKQAGNDDVITLSKSDDADNLEIRFESKSADRVGEYEMKTMDIDAEHLGIPDTTYSSVVKFSSSEYARIVRDLLVMGEAVKISVAKDGVSFEASGEIGNAKLQLKQGAGGASSKSTSKKEKEEKEEKEKKAKKEGEEEEEEEDDEEDDDEEEKPKKRKAQAQTSGNKKRAKKDDDDEKSGPVQVDIQMQQATSMSFALKYLNHFAKAGPLCDTVALSMTDDLPLMVGYEFEGGHVRFFLAPKIDEDNDDE